MHSSLLFFLLFLSAGFADHCIFTPPAGWEIAQLKNPSPYVKIGFVGKPSGEFRPSINLATEETDAPLKEYLQAVKELQTADPKTQWRDLGKFSMQSGTGRLIEISSPSPFGEMKILQAIFVSQGKAYILTAASLKEDLPKLQNELLKSFQSLNLIHDLWTPIQDPQKRAQFRALFSSLGQEDQTLEWKKLQAQVGSEPQLGPYWQFLALQEGYAKIYPPGEK